MKKDLSYILTFTERKGDCLEWTRCFNTDGYPRAIFDGNSNGKVHRVVFELATGLSATGLVVRHTCDNPKCINPDHLLLGTPADNMRDRDIRARHGRTKTNQDAVRAMRKLWETGNFRQKTLATIFGIDARTVSGIVNYTQWKHVV